MRLKPKIRTWRAWYDDNRCDVRAPWFWLAKLIARWRFTNVMPRPDMMKDLDK